MTSALPALKPPSLPMNTPSPAMMLSDDVEGFSFLHAVNIIVANKSSVNVLVMFDELNFMFSDIYVEGLMKRIRLVLALVAIVQIDNLFLLH